MIRKFRPSDEDRCIRIVSECFDKSVILNKKSKEYVKNLFTTKGYFTQKSHKYNMYVYCKDKKILGMGALNGNYISKIYVIPSMHGKGIGRQMMTFLERCAIKKGCKETVLHAYKNARRFYSKQGYTYTKMFIYNEQSGTKTPTYEMRKTLN
jgi:ribosomal protein S18 acetylase RimI-like enzyme